MSTESTFSSDEYSLSLTTAKNEITLLYETPKAENYYNSVILQENSYNCHYGCVDESMQYYQRLPNTSVYSDTASRDRWVDLSTNGYIPSWRVSYDSSEEEGETIYSKTVPIVLSKSWEYSVNEDTGCIDRADKTDILTIVTRESADYEGNTIYPLYQLYISNSCDSELFDMIYHQTCWNGGYRLAVRVDDSKLFYLEAPSGSRAAVGARDAGRFANREWLRSMNYPHLSNPAEVNTSDPYFWYALSGVDMNIGIDSITAFNPTDPSNCSSIPEYIAAVMSEHGVGSWPEDSTGPNLVVFSSYKDSIGRIDSASMKLCLFDAGYFPGASYVMMCFDDKNLYWGGAKIVIPEDQDFEETDVPDLLKSAEKIVICAPDSVAVRPTITVRTRAEVSGGTTGDCSGAQISLLDDQLAVGQYLGSSGGLSLTPKSGSYTGNKYYDIDEESETLTVTAAIDDYSFGTDPRSPWHSSMSLTLDSTIEGETIHYSDPVISSAVAMAYPNPDIEESVYSALLLTGTVNPSIEMNSDSTYTFGSSEIGPMTLGSNIPMDSVSGAFGISASAVVSASYSKAAPLTIALSLYGANPNALEADLFPGYALNYSYSEQKRDIASSEALNVTRLESTYSEESDSYVVKDLILGELESMYSTVIRLEISDSYGTDFEEVDLDSFTMSFRELYSNDDVPEFKLLSHIVTSSETEDDPTICSACIYYNYKFSKSVDEDNLYYIDIAIPSKGQSSDGKINGYYDGICSIKYYDKAHTSDYDEITGCCTMRVQGNLPALYLDPTTLKKAVSDAEDPVLPAEASRVDFEDYYDNALGYDSDAIFTNSEPLYSIFAVAEVPTDLSESLGYTGISSYIYNSAYSGLKIPLPIEEVAQDTATKLMFTEIGPDDSKTEYYAELTQTYYNIDLSIDNWRELASKGLFDNTVVVTGIIDTI